MSAKFQITINIVIDLKFYSILAVIVCDPLFLDHGTVTYTTDTQAPHDYGTVATFSCNNGFELIGNVSRLCTGDGTSASGAWTGVISYCK